MSKTKAQRPPKPKPPRTAFMCFYQLHQQKLKDANSSLSFGEINTVVVNAWKGIGGAEKQQCDQLAQKDKTRYQRELRGEFENCVSEVRSSAEKGTQAACSFFLESGISCLRSLGGNRLTLNLRHFSVNCVP
jgi:hypothetical protein